MLKFFVIIILPNLLFSNSTFRAMMENDAMFPPSDKYFTNGIRFEYWREKKLLKENSFLPCDKRTGYQFGQNMYTPSDVRKADPESSDRPYAGYLYFGASQNLFCNSFQQKFEINLGSTGKTSYAEKTQEGLHRIIGSKYPIGWDKQIPEKGTIQINSESRFVIQKNFSLFNFIQFGNLFQSVGFSPSFRFGKIESKYFTGYNSMQTGVPVETSEREFYFYIQPSVIYMHYDGTLQGAKKSLLQKEDSSTILETYLQNKNVENSYYYNLLYSNNESTLEGFHRFLFAYKNNLPESDAVNFFLYNSLFNGNIVLTDKERIHPIYLYFKDSIEKNPNLTSDQKIFLFLNMNNDQKGSFQEASRILAVKIFLDANKNPNNLNWLDFLLIRELARENKPKYVEPQNYQGRLETGFILSTISNSYFQLGGVFQTAEFKNSGDLPPYHLRGFFQFGQNF